MGQYVNKVIGNQYVAFLLIGNGTGTNKHFEKYQIESTGKLGISKGTYLSYLKITN